MPRTGPEAANLESRYYSLIADIANADEGALATFYDITASRVYALALRITRDAQAAEEVVVDVYFQIWRQAERYEPHRGPIMTWLLTICRSRSLDYLRRRVSASKLLGDDIPSPSPVTGQTDPLDILLTVERDSIIYPALATLAPSEQQLLSLAFFNGFTHQEIATQTRIPLGTVKTTIRKALLNMKQMLRNPFVPSERNI